MQYISLQLPVSYSTSDGTGRRGGYDIKPRSSPRVYFFYIFLFFFQTCSFLPSLSHHHSFFLNQIPVFPFFSPPSSPSPLVSRSAGRRLCMIRLGENKIPEVLWNVPIFADTACITGNARWGEGRRDRLEGGRWGYQCSIQCRTVRVK